ncbi:MAG: hypothetical protein N3A38_09660 [Planctomycetota bacterium]|nr:hypothetical protein [Planctomycetota bacterium]
MPAVFVLKRAKLSAGEWNELLGEWEDGLERPLYDEAVLDEEGDEPSLRIWGPGSTRGVVLRLRNGGRWVAVALESLASLVDWRMGFEIMRLAMRRGGGNWTRSGRAYNAEALSPERAAEESGREFLADARILSEALKKTTAKGLLLSNGIFDLTITPAEIESCSDGGDVRRIEGAIAARVFRYVTAPRRLPQPLEEDRIVQFFEWDGERALLRGRAELMAVRAEDGQRAFVPFWTAVGILGHAAEPLGDNATYLSDLDPRAAAAARDALLREAVPLEKWLREHVEEIRAARSLSFLRMTAGSFASTVLSGGDPMAGIQWLAPDEDFAEMLKAVCIATMKAMRKMYVEGREPDRAIEELVAEGLERPVAEAIVDGVLDAAIKDAPGEEEKGEQEGEG